jgi:hypothetical protein
MTIHADNTDVQEQAVRAIHNVVYFPAHIAMAKAAGVVPLLQRAKGQGVQYASEVLGATTASGSGGGGKKRKKTNTGGNDQVSLDAFV